MNGNTKLTKYYIINYINLLKKYIYFTTVFTFTFTKAVISWNFILKGLRLLEYH